MDAGPIAARHEAVLQRLIAAARDDERIVAAWLQGSRADGTADAFSDIDFYIAVADEAYESFDKLAFIERTAPVLVHFEPPFLPGVICLLEGPVKLDLLVDQLSTVGRQLRAAVLMLIDKAGVESSLRTGWVPGDDQVAPRVNEAIRMTFQGGTWPIRLLRRGQWTTHAYSELTLIEGVIVPLMLVQQDPFAFQRNQFSRAKHLNEAERREVDELAQEVLAALASRSLATAYRAHLHIVELLARVGRAACKRFGLAYPEAAERELLRFYEREWPT
ncbi:MAG: nucleotidyltransferase domain-containing protein [Dehalococcoidia bacterium]